MIAIEFSINKVDYLSRKNSGWLASVSGSSRSTPDVERSGLEDQTDDGGYSAGWKAALNGGQMDRPTDIRNETR